MPASRPHPNAVNPTAACADAVRLATGPPVMPRSAPDVPARASMAPSTYTIPRPPSDTVTGMIQTMNVAFRTGVSLIISGTSSGTWSETSVSLFSNAVKPSTSTL